MTGTTIMIEFLLTFSRDFLTATLIGTGLSLFIFCVCSAAAQRSQWFNIHKSIWLIASWGSMFSVIFFLMPLPFGIESSFMLKPLLPESFSTPILSVENNRADGVAHSFSFYSLTSLVWLVIYSCISLIMLTLGIRKHVRIRSIINEAVEINRVKKQFLESQVISAEAKINDSKRIDNEKDKKLINKITFKINDKTRRRVDLLNALSRRLNILIKVTQRNISPFIYQGKSSVLVLSEFALLNLDDDEFRCLLKHELVHIQQKDGLVKNLNHWLLCFYWFNPFICYFLQKLDWATEVSCDETVLEQCSKMRRTYALTMLKILRQTATHDANQIVAAFSSTSQRSLSMRISYIMKPSYHRIKPSLKNICLGGLGGLIALGAITFHPALIASDVSKVNKMLHPVAGAKISSVYGANNRFHKFHRGIDLAAEMDTPVLAAAEGKVIVSTRSLKGHKNYGTIIIIEHGNGLKSLYSHLNSTHVSKGDYVNAGELIGRVGQTGRATGPHVHFEILRDGKRVDPNQFVNFSVLGR